MTRRLALGLGLAAVLMLARPAHAQLAWEPFTFTPRGHPEVTAERAVLTVPLRHAVADGPTLKLRVVRLSSKRQARDDAPVVYLAGGPGGSGVAAARGARWPVFDAVRRGHDVILLDQRGTGESSPPPACPYKVELDPGRGYDGPGLLAQFKQVAARCMTHWRDRGLDPDAFNTRESAADLKVLQQALSARSLSLWGMSYGTHLALAALKQPGLDIDRLLLMGVEGPDQTIKWPMDADALIARTGAAAGMPDLLQRLRRRVEALQREPMKIKSPTPVVMSAFDLQLVVAALLGRHQTALMIPSLVSELEAGRDEMAGAILGRFAEGMDAVALMPLAMDVASGASPARLAEVRAQERESVLGAALNFPFPQIGDGLGVTDLGDAFRADPRSARPTQFVSGQFDGRTPASNVKALEPGFSRRGHWIVDAAGHDDELWLTSAELPGLIVRFFDGAEASDLKLAAQAKPAPKAP